MDTNIMNVHSLIPLIATILFIPIFIMLLLNRPWHLQHKLFLLYLIPAMLWSLSDFLGRSHLPWVDVELMVKLVGCFAIWMGIQIHYFMFPFYRKEAIRIPFVYLLLVGTVALALLGYMPRGVEVTPDTIVVRWGIWLTSIAFILIALVGRDIYLLRRRQRTSPDVVERNQLVYLIFGIMIATVLIALSFIPAIGGFPIAHIGNLTMACILTYAIVAHRLLDVAVAVRRVLRWLVLVAVGSASRTHSQ
jgi:hypothetical protein